VDEEVEDDFLGDDVLAVGITGSSSSLSVAAVDVVVVGQAFS
jgi:hypothetical protein